jgi:hypothetical protein
MLLLFVHRFGQVAGLDVSRSGSRADTKIRRTGVRGMAGGFDSGCAVLVQRDAPRGAGQRC